jgi:transcriptional regulator with XRE-family HTH domain
MELREILARNVRKRRNRLGLNQDELADLAKMDRTYVSKIENCRNAATVDMIEKLAAAFGLEPPDLLRPDLD